MGEGRKQRRNAMDEMKCPKCESAMETGHILDTGYNVGQWTLSQWIEGFPEKAFWFGVKIKGRRIFTITAHRCVNCGYLEFYATEDRKEKPKRG
jgi:predicted nucleic-acid-binding Zn-ribbon protein